jgi:hypothetical protein
MFNNWRIFVQQQKQKAITMGQNYAVQNTKRRSNVRLIAIMGIVLAAIIIAAVAIITTVNGNGLSGRYELPTDSNACFDFKREGTVVIYTGKPDQIMDAMYTLNDNRLEIRVKSAEGLDVLFARGTVSDNKQEIVLNIYDAPVTFVKK